MKLHEIWKNDDNKKIVDQRDRQYVALTEPYELRYFIEAFLNDQGKEHTDINKQAVLDAINSYSGRAPILRTALTSHVLKSVKWPSAPVQKSKF